MRAAAAFALPLLLAGCAASGAYGPDDWLRPAANPSKVIAAELAFARMAREEGTWTAFRHYATDDALWPSPELVRVQDELSDMPDPSEPILWEPDTVWSSCDGSFAVSTGEAVDPDGRRSQFVRVWQRQNDGDYRWLLDQTFGNPQAQAEPEAVEAHVADCPAERRPAGRARSGEAWGSNRSDDGTLAWSTDTSADCSRVLTVRLRREGTMQEVLRRKAEAPENTPVNACAG